MRSCSVYLLSDIDPIGAGIIGRFDNKMYEYTSEQLKHGFVGDVKLLRAKWVEAGCPPPEGSVEWRETLKKAEAEKTNPYAKGWGKFLKFAQNSFDNFEYMNHERKIACAKQGECYVCD